MKLKNILTTGAFCSSLLFGAQTHAANENISAWMSMDVNSHFMSYGYNVWGNKTKDIGDTTLFNPSAGIDLEFTENSGGYIGIWADVNDLAETTIGRDIQEVDVWIGYYISFGDFTFDLAYQAWMYAEQNEGIVDFTISYDTMFSPYVLFHNRVEANGDQEEGTMLVIGGTIYEHTFEETGISIDFPIGVGYALTDFHVKNEDGYTYSFIGANASYPLPISDAYGEWDLHGGLTFYGTEKKTTGNADSSYLTATFGVGVSF